jgi:hypothetical protein
MHEKKTKTSGNFWKENKSWRVTGSKRAWQTHAWNENKIKSTSVVAWRRKETKDEWCMLCSLYNSVSGRCVRIRDQCTACARSSGEMHMHTYHGGYPTISHSYILKYYVKDY